jgi:hypothetical protein
MMFVIVSETLITGTLCAVPDDPRVVLAVTETVRDHAVDEGRHHAYFANFLRYFWAELDQDQRRTAALAVPDLLFAFLEPDEPAMRAELRSYGLSEGDAREVIFDVFPESSLRRDVRSASKQTLRYVTNLDVLSDPEVRDSYESWGLL